MDESVAFPFRHLWKHVSLLFSHQHPPVEDIQHVLRKHLPALQQPLTVKDKNSVDRSSVQAQDIVLRGNKTHLTQEFVQNTLKLSDLLGINELSACELLQSAALGGPTHSDQLPRAGLELFYRERSYLLQALLDLIKGRNVEHVSPVVKNLIITFTDDLLNDGLIATIHAQLSKALQSTEATSTARDELAVFRRRARLSEAVLLAQILFFTTYQSPLESDTAIAILDLCRTTGAAYAKYDTPAGTHGSKDGVAGSGAVGAVGRAGAVQPGLSGFGQAQGQGNQSGRGGLNTTLQGAESGVEGSTAASLFQIAYLTHFTMVQALMHPYQAIRDGSGEPYVFNTLVDSVQFASQCSSKLKGSEWAHLGFQGILRFSWALFLEAQRTQTAQAPAQQFTGDVADEIDEFLSLALEQGTLSFLSKSLIENPTFHRDHEIKPFIIHICDDVMARFLTDMPNQVTLLKNDDSQFQHRGDNNSATSAFDGFGNEPNSSVRRNHFADLMITIAAVCNGNPDYAVKYWTKDHDLFNFVKFAGDYLLPSHYVAYLTMLTALGSGRECADSLYAFLSELNTFISWNHFFEVLIKYRRELVPQAQGAGASGGAAGGGAGTEKQFQRETVDGLIAILSLLQQVLRWSPDKRTVIANNPQWQPVYSLFELLKCPVPLDLKAALLNTLARFAESPEIAVQIWNELEEAQILQTIPRRGAMDFRSRGPGSSQHAGLKFELEERETPRQEYPVTRAFMSLIGELVKHHQITPEDLGRRSRVPGVIPYVQFILSDVFQQFDQRGYAQQGDRWHIARAVLDIAVTILRPYDCSLDSDFALQEIDIGGQRVALNPSPGFEIISSFLSGGNFFRKVMFSVLDTGIQGLRNEAVTGTGENLAACEASIRLALELCSLVFERQDVFIRRVRASPSTSSNFPALVNGLDALLMREQRLIVKIANYIHADDNPSLQYASISVMYHLASRQSGLPIVFLDLNEHISLIHGYVNCLRRAETDAELGECEPDAPLPATMESPNDLYVAVLRLLIDGLSMPTPNLTQLLCGYDVTRDISDTTISSATSSMTCLHAVLDLVNSPTFLDRQPVLVEACYRVLYQLCASTPTSLPTLLYLRSENQDFYARHIGPLAQLNLQKMDNRVQRLSELRRYAWMMKMLALDLHVVSMTKHDNLAHRHYSQRIVTLLFSSSSDADVDTTLGGESNYPLSYEQQQELASRNQAKHSFPLLQLFNAVSTPLHAAPVSVEEKLQRTQLRVDLQACIMQQNGISMYDIEALHHTILQAQRWDWNTTGSNRDQDVRSLLQAAVDYNACATMLHGQSIALDGWKQVLEASLSHCYNLVPVDIRGRALFQLLQSLLTTAATKDFLPPLPVTLGKAAHSLMFKIREQSTYAQAIDDLFSYPASKCEDILLAIVKIIMKPSTSHQIRGDMYGTLHHYLKYAARRGDVASSLPGSDSAADSAEATTQHRLWLSSTAPDAGQVDDLVQVNLRVLSHYGEQLVDRIGRDAADGLYVWKSMAFAALDSLLVFDQHETWATNLFSRGIIPQLLDELSHSDAHLQKLLLGDQSQSGVRYVYEALFSLLVQAAQSLPGALAMIEYGVIPILTKARYLDYRPDSSTGPATGASGKGDEDAEGNMVDVDTGAMIFRQLWRPPLCLLVSIMSLLGKNEDAAEQVFAFIDSHHKIISTILKDRVSFITEHSLEHLSLVTALFYRLAFHPKLTQAKFQSRASKYQDVILQLFNKYMDADGYKHKVPQGQSMTRIQTLVEDVLRNVLGYIRVTCHQWQTLSGGIDAVIFAPFPTDGTAAHSSYHEPQNGTSAVPARILPLQSLVTCVVQSIERMIAYRQSAQDCTYKLSQLQSVRDDQVVAPSLRELLDIYGSGSTSDPDIQQLLQWQQEGGENIEPARLVNMVRHTLNTKARTVASNLQSCLFVLENALVVYWQHLQFYITRDAGAASANVAQPGSTVDDLFQASSALFTLTSADKERLCHQQAATLLPSLARLQQAAESSGNSTLDFTLVLSRRIKALLGEMGRRASDTTAPNGMVAR